VHRNAPLTPEGRLRLCERIAQGWPVAHAAASMGISRDRAYVWWRRFQAEGIAGLEDRSSRPHRSPARTKASVERRIVGLRITTGRGPARIAGIVGQHASTVHRVLVRHGLNRLDHLDRPTRAPIRRMTMTRPGELVHVDIKKLGRIPRGGGWRVHGRGKTKRAKVGYAFVHSAVDGYTRIAYSEVLTNERGVTAAGFWVRAAAFYATFGIVIERVITDNGPATRAQSSTTRSARKSNTRSFAPTDPRRMARWNGSTGRCSPNGPTPGPGPQTVNGPVHLPAGCTSTTITDATLPSAAHPSAKSATCQGTTSSLG
jgi:transposase